MKLSPRLVGAVALAWMLVAVPPMFGQSDDDARAVVLQAVDDLAAGYQFTGSSTQSQTLTDDANSYEILTNYAVAGTTAANGDYHLTTAITTTQSDAAVETVPPFNMELISVDGVLYVNFQTAGTIYETEYENFTPGWHVFDDLLASIDDPIQQQILQTIVNVPSPASLQLTDDLIEAVTEGEAETLDGVDVRVFDVTMNALEVFGSQSPQMSVDELLKSAGLIAASEFDLTYTLYIGTEDGHLYRVTGAGRSLIPYRSEEFAGGPPYDIEITSAVDFILTQHGAVEAITAPDVPAD